MRTGLKIIAKRSILGCRTAKTSVSCKSTERNKANSWLVAGFNLPLWKIWLHHLGWWLPIDGQIKHSSSKAPTPVKGFQQWSPTCYKSPGGRVPPPAPPAMPTRVRKLSHREVDRFHWVSWLKSPDISGQSLTVGSCVWIRRMPSTYFLRIPNTKKLKSMSNFGKCQVGQCDLQVIPLRKQVENEGPIWVLHPVTKTSQHRRVSLFGSIL